MPRQPLHDRRGKLRTHSPNRLSTFLARVLLFMGTFGLSAYGISEMYAVLGEVTILQWAFLLLFSLNFTWIAFAGCQAVMGFLLIVLRDMTEWRNTRVELPTINTAILVPVYNEEPVRVAAAITAMAEALTQQAPGRFSFFILSDSNNPMAWIREERIFSRLVEASSAECPVYYRQRHHNSERKAGNIADWVMRWGGAYEAMLVLDADSIMTAETIIEMARRLQADPGLGLLQTLPSIVMGESLYARLQQFANRLYGPVFGNGLSAWHGVGSNFWGHNAIIRTKAFAAAAHLPVLKGKAPFGGHVISHDFIEAALLRRAGWGVRFDTDLQGSYEEAPPSISDVLIRDRRWCQGNMQHIRFLFARGLAWTTRLHILSGIMAYVSAVFWFLLLTVGVALAVQAGFTRPEYFAQPSLFPTWPVFDSARSVSLFILSMGLVLLPKLLAWATAMLNLRRCWQYGGPILVTLSVIVEVFLSALVAPIMMVAQSQMVKEVLTGGDSGWKPQRRNDGSISLGAAMRLHRWHMLIGFATAGVTWYLHHDLFFWMLPVTGGLMVSALLSWLSGKIGPGRFLRFFGVLRTPEEKRPPQILQSVHSCMESMTERPQTAPVQVLLSDPDFRDWHCAQLQPDSSSNTAFDPELILARAKAERSISAAALEDWLTLGEEMALLHSPDLIRDVVASLPVRSQAR